MGDFDWKTIEQVLAEFHITEAELLSLIENDDLTIKFVQRKGKNVALFPEHQIARNYFRRDHPVEVKAEIIEAFKVILLGLITAGGYDVLNGILERRNSVKNRARPTATAQYSSTRFVVENLPEAMAMLGMSDMQLCEISGISRRSIRAMKDRQQMQWFAVNRVQHTLEEAGLSKGHLQVTPVR